jgi:two-component system sensor histidine kinase/response regulator
VLHDHVQSRMGAVSESMDPSSHPGPDPAVFDRELALSYVGSPRILASAVEAFAAAAPETLAVMRSAMAQGNWTLLQTEAHGLKGALGMLGAPAAAAVAQRLETLCRQQNLPDAGRALGDLERELERLMQALRVLYFPGPEQSPEGGR